MNFCLNEEENEEIFTVTSQEKNMRLDHCLTARYSPTQSRSYFQQLIEVGAVLLNGNVVKKKTKVKEGDIISLHFLYNAEMALEPEPIPLSILYEDEQIIAIDKPVGMVVHPAPGNWVGTFVNGLLYHCQQQNIFLDSVEGCQQRPGVVHRLDKETTGVLVAAKTIHAHRCLAMQFSERKVFKEYIAICVGNPGSGVIDAPLGRHPHHRQMMAVVQGGRRAITHYQTVAYQGKFSLVRVLLETGRTHQIRVHMRHLGTPLLGDAVYGNQATNRLFGIQRQMLHARQLGIAHPLSGKKMTIEAKIPSDMFLAADSLSLKKRNHEPEPVAFAWLGQAMRDDVPILAI